MDVEADNLRHKRDEAIRKEIRKSQRENKSASRIEKERRRKAHQQETLKKVNKGTQGSRKPKPPPPPPSTDNKKDSKFQALFAERSQGFIIELNFRNAPPRPPVGPCFVGLGLDGELNDKWTKYKPDNAIEANYAWKLHAEPDLGVPLAPSAMDYEGCYVDPSKAIKKKKKNEAYDELFDEVEEDEEETPGPAPLDAEDENLVNWKGHLGDSVAEELQRLRDKARAEARLGVKGMKPSSNTSNQNTFLKKSKDVKSRVLAEKNPFFMKKTTYLANDHTQRVHDFKSLAQTQREKEAEIQKKLSNKKSNDTSVIEHSFALANQKSTGKRKHPSKDNVEAVYEIPLLPDEETWGHSFIHVVLDSLPKKDVIQREITDEEIETAFIGDVQKGKKNQRMECNLLLANNADSNQYDIVHKYDLDVIPLKEEGTPHAHFLFVVDEEKGVATYHPIPSRVQLSSGRPSDDAGMRKITKRDLDEDELNDIETKLAEVDADLAQKHGNVDEEVEEVEEEHKNEQPKTFSSYANFDSSSDEEM